MTNYHDPSDKSKPQETLIIYTTPNTDGSVNVERVIDWKVTEEFTGVWQAPWLSTIKD